MDEYQTYLEVVQRYNTNNIKMKKRLAKWLLLVAKRLDQQIHVANAQVIEDYEAKKVGLTYIVTKKDLKEYRFRDGTNMSMREARRRITNDIRKKIFQSIIDSVEAKRLIEYDIRRVDGGFSISGELKIYIPTSHE